GGAAEDAGKSIGEPGRRVMCRAEFKCPGAFGNPGRMLVDAAEAGDELGLLHAARTVETRRWVGRGPVAGNVEAPGEPDALVPPRVIEKALQPGDLARPPDQAAVQADRHHLCRTRLAFGIEHVEGVLEILEELLACDVAGGRGEAHV